MKHLMYFIILLIGYIIVYFLLKVELIRWIGNYLLVITGYFSCMAISRIGKK